MKGRRDWREDISLGVSCLESEAWHRFEELQVMLCEQLHSPTSLTASTTSSAPKHHPVPSENTLNPFFPARGGNSKSLVAFEACTAGGCLPLLQPQGAGGCWSYPGTGTATGRS